MTSRLALFLAKTAEPERAAQLINSLDLEALTANGHYRLAVAREVSGERLLALEALGRALEGGYGFVEVESDPELAELRQDSGYAALRDRGTELDSGS